MTDEPVVLRVRLCSLHVCVPKDYTDEQVVEFANSAVPTGIESRWQITREGSKDLVGDPERNTCSQDPNRVHIRLEC